MLTFFQLLQCDCYTLLFTSSSSWFFVGAFVDLFAVDFETKAKSHRLVHCKCVGFVCFGPLHLYVLRYFFTYLSLTFTLRRTSFTIALPTMVRIAYIFLSNAFFSRDHSQWMSVFVCVSYLVALDPGTNLSWTKPSKKYPQKKKQKNTL